MSLWNRTTAAAIVAAVLMISRTVCAGFKNRPGTHRPPYLSTSAASARLR
jgi:hypothetical protein